VEIYLKINMDISQAIILGLIQGFTEFLPISSSGHLILAQEFLDLEVGQLAAFDVMVHMGTLLAIIAYFRKDFAGFAVALFNALRRKKLETQESEYSRLLEYIILASVPAVLVGLSLEDFIVEHFRSAQAVALNMIVSGIFFITADYIFRRVSKSEITLRRAIVVGLFQAFALLPGVSRSGTTISAALLGGIDREQAARFSFLLGSPVMLGAGVLTAAKLFFNGGEIGFSWVALLLGFLTSAASGYLCIALLMKFLKRHSLLVFAAYLIVVGLSISAYQLWF
jgi:undecaprenyl-diphosphatase